jgi:hypothetical protein
MRVTLLQAALALLTAPDRGAIQQASEQVSTQTRAVEEAVQDSLALPT